MDTKCLTLLKSEDMNYLLNDLKADEIADKITFEEIPATYDTIPSNESYSGQFNFEMRVHSSKHSKILYSTKLNKLYMKMLHDFVVEFRYDYIANQQFYIRAKPRYSSQEDANKPVKRCLQHLIENDHSNIENPNIRHHVLRCKNTMAIYDGGLFEHHNVVIPIHAPEAGSDFISQTFQFVCQNSCGTGMNRRPIEIIFTLEDQSRNVLGRQTVNIRICSCPLRDKNLEEEKYEKENTKNSKQLAGKKRKIPFDNVTTNQVTNINDNNSLQTLNISVVGADNKAAVLKYIYDLHAGNILRGEGNAILNKYVMEEVVRLINN